MATSATYVTMNGMIVYENRGGVERDYVPDTLGSTVALLDSSQTKTDTWRYWPYGEVAARTGTHVTPFTFVGVLGYFKDLLDKLLYVRARHYLPDKGRWLTVDPYWPGERAFCYPGNPVSMVDPEGTSASCTECLWKLREWGGNNPIHLCYSNMSHCMACCTLKFLFGTPCALLGQLIQADVRNPFIWQIPENNRRWGACQEGLRIGATSVEDCQAGCARAYQKDLTQHGCPINYVFQLPRCGCTVSCFTPHCSPMGSTWGPSYGPNDQVPVGGQRKTISGVFVG